MPPYMNWKVFKKTISVVLEWFSFRGSRHKSKLAHAIDKTLITALKFQYKTMFSVCENEGLDINQVSLPHPLCYDKTNWRYFHDYNINC